MNSAKHVIRLYHPIRIFYILCSHNHFNILSLFVIRYAPSLVSLGGGILPSSKHAKSIIHELFLSHAKKSRLLNYPYMSTLH